MRGTRGRCAAIATATAAALLAPAATATADAPAVTTTGAAQITITTATLTGQVNPRGLATTYFFQYGTTTAYGTRTPSSSAGGGGAPVAAAANLTGLAPNTRYHFRLVARNRDGTTLGANRSFRTPPQPLGLALSATPNPISLGAPTTLTGTLSGTNNAGRVVQVQQNPFPFTAAFTNVGNAVVTDAQGNFAVALVTVAATTQYRVLVADRPAVVSPVVTVAVLARVRTDVTRTRVRRGGRVRFSGTVRPAEERRPMAIQKRTSTGRWITVAGMRTRRGGSRFSLYGKAIRVRRGGDYRVYVGAGGGATAPNAGRTVRIRTFR